MGERNNKKGPIEEQTVEEWNATRLAELEIAERDLLDRETDLAFFPRPTRFTCSSCGQMNVCDEAHIDHSGKYWKRQTICYHCHHMVYRYL